jgi:hypothetical protein
VDEGSDQTWQFDAPGVLANDEATGGSAELVSGTSNGSLSLHSDGSFEYTPGPDYFGLDSFTYRVRSGSGTSSIATVTIHVTPVNDSPRFTLTRDQIESDARPQTVPRFATGITAGANGNESDQAIEFFLSTDNGDLFAAGPTISDEGTLTYTPSGRTGSASVTVVLVDNGGTANGGSDSSVPQRFAITVR